MQCSWVFRKWFSSSLRRILAWLPVQSRPISVPSSLPKTNCPASDLCGWLGFNEGTGENKKDIIFFHKKKSRKNKWNRFDCQANKIWRVSWGLFRINGEISSQLGPHLTQVYVYKILHFSVHLKKVGISFDRFDPKICIKALLILSQSITRVVYCRPHFWIAAVSEARILLRVFE